MESATFHVYLADFGVAKVLTKGTLATSKTNSSSSSIGTPGFQPMEQLKASDIDESVDVYALGCVFVELFGGKKIWEGLSAIQIMVKVAVEGQVPAFSHLPSSVQPICDVCLQPKERRCTSSILLHAVLAM